MGKKNSHKKLDLKEIKNSAEAGNIRQTKQKNTLAPSILEDIDSEIRFPTVYVTEIWLFQQFWGLGDTRAADIRTR